MDALAPAKRVFIDRNNAQHLTYYDTGPPENPQGQYRTLVCMHGIKYRSPVFQRLIPYAKQANIRLILVDRRGYGDSAPIDDVEIARATDPKSGADGFIKFHIARGFEVAQFLLTFIREEAIQGQKVTLLGWSAGNRNVAGFLAALPQLPASELAVLRASLAGIIMWETPHRVFGLPEPPQAYNPLHDTSLSQAERLARFDDWSSGYFKHGAEFSIDSFEYRHWQTDKLPTIQRMSSSDKNEMIDTRASEGEIAISKAGSDTGAALALIEMALYPCNDSMAMPELKVTIMWAAETLWEIAYAGTYFQHYLLHTSKARRTQRPVEFVTLPQGNHFFHWDHPEVCMRAFESAM